MYQGTHVSFFNLAPDSTYYFRLRADISGRVSVLSDMVNVVTPPTSKTLL